MLYFQSQFQWLKHQNLTFHRFKEVGENISVIMDSVFMENNEHIVRNLDMEITNSILINYHLLYNGTRKTGLREFCIQNSKLQAAANSLQSVSLDISRGNGHFNRVHVYDVHQKEPIIHIQEGSTSIFNNCTISGSYVPQKKSSLIKVNNSAAFLQNCAFHDNVGYEGGVLYAKNSMVNITQSIFIKNRALISGGSVYLLGAKATILNCTFKKNYAFSYGGAISGMRSTVYGRINTFLKNSAQIHGGAIFGESNSTFEIENITFILNKAVDHEGGSIGLINGNMLFVNNSHFEKSSGVQSGVILAKNYNILNIANTNFTENRGVLNTGVLRIQNFGNGTFKNCRFESNVGALTESVITAYRNVSVIMEGCLFYNNSSPFSGILMGRDSVDLHMNNCQIRGNEAKLQSLIEVGNHSSISVISSLFSQNTGGSLVFGDVGTTVLFMNTTFVNHALFADPLIVVSGSNLTLQNSNFFSITQNKEGSIAATRNKGVVQVKSSLFVNNQASKGGSFYVIEGSELSVQNSTFKNNFAGDASVALLIDSRATFLNVSVTNGTSYGYGGILTGYNSKFFLHHCNFSHGKAVFGGCIYLEGNSSIAAYDSVFENSYARNGGAIFKFGPGNVSLENCSFISNTGLHGGSIYQLDSPVLRIAEGTCEIQPKTNISCIAFKCDNYETCRLQTYNFTLYKDGKSINSRRNKRFPEEARKSNLIKGFHTHEWLEIPYASCEYAKTLKEPISPIAKWFPCQQKQCQTK